MKKLKFPEVFHTHINLSGRSEIFGGFWENLSQMHLLPRHSFLFPSFSMLLPNPHLWSVQARTSEKHIFSDLEIRRDSAWLSFEAFSYGCFPLCQSRFCLSQVLSYWDEARWTPIETDEWLGSRLRYWTQAFLFFSHRRYHHAVSYFAPFYQQASSAWGLE